MVRFVLTHDEVNTLISYCKGKGHVHWENAIIFEIQYYLMRRISEVVTLKIEQIFFEERKILFYQTKTETFYMKAPDFILEDLRRVIGMREKGYVFRPRGPTNKTGHVSRGTVNLALHQYATELGYNRVVGMKPIKLCSKCPGKVGEKCKFNNMKYIQLVPIKKCIREGRPIFYRKDHLVHSHILRASSATTLLKAGYSEFEVMRWGHWKDRGAFQRYVVLGNDRTLVDAWDAIKKTGKAHISSAEILAELKDIKEIIINGNYKTRPLRQGGVQRTLF